jgi:hypothetical protein
MHRPIRYLPLDALSDEQQAAVIRAFADLQSSAWMAGRTDNHIVARFHAESCRKLIAAFGRPRAATGVVVTMVSPNDTIRGRRRVRRDRARARTLRPGARPRDGAGGSEAGDQARGDSAHRPGGKAGSPSAAEKLVEKEDPEYIAHRRAQFDAEIEKWRALGGVEVARLKRRLTSALVDNGETR